MAPGRRRSLQQLVVTLDGQHRTDCARHWRLFFAAETQPYLLLTLCSIMIEVALKADISTFARP